MKILTLEHELPGATAEKFRLYSRAGALMEKLSAFWHPQSETSTID